MQEQMVQIRSDPSGITQSWDAYWQGIADARAFSSGGANHPANVSFWNEFFRFARDDLAVSSLVDLASGTGAVVEIARDVFGGGAVEMTAIDISAAAVASIRQRFPLVKSLVMDLKSIDLADENFDLVTSQFGIEYAGMQAVVDAARLVRENGWLAFLMHSTESSIYRQCADNLSAVERVIECRFVPRSIEMFRAGFAAVRGADRIPYDQAAKRLSPAVGELESIIAEYGQEVADDTIACLYGYVARIHENIQHHDPDEVLGWLERMQEELETYAGRMSSMCESAIDEDGLDRICNQLRSQEFTITTVGPLLSADGEVNLGWALIARKGRTTT